MLILQFQVGPNLYAIDCRRLVEVLPRVPLRRVPHAPPYLVGLLHYRGPVVPVLDLGLLFGDSASANRLSTRILVADSSPDPDRPALVGLMAERVSELRRVAELGADASAVGTSVPYLGAILETEDGLVQLVRVEGLPRVAAVLQEQA